MNEDDLAGVFGAIGFTLIVAFCLFILTIVVITIAGMWKTFEKAGKPGWAAIVPIYNYIVLLEIAGRPLWWIFLFLIPLVNLVFIVIVYMDLSRSFGHDVGFAIGLILLAWIFYPILGFGASRYLGPAGPEGRGRMQQPV